MKDSGSLALPASAPGPAPASAPVPAAAPAPRPTVRPAAAQAPASEPALAPGPAPGLPWSLVPVGIRRRKSKWDADAPQDGAGGKAVVPEVPAPLPEVQADPLPAPVPTTQAGLPGASLTASGVPQGAAEGKSEVPAETSDAPPLNVDAQPDAARHSARQAESGKEEVLRGRSELRQQQPQPQPQQEQQHQQEPQRRQQQQEVRIGPGSKAEASALPLGPEAGAPPPTGSRSTARCERNVKGGVRVLEGADAGDGLRVLEVVIDIAKREASGAHPAHRQHSPSSGSPAVWRQRVLQGEPVPLYDVPPGVESERKGQEKVLGVRLLPLWPRGPRRATSMVHTPARRAVQHESAGARSSRDTDTPSMDHRAAGRAEREADGGAAGAPTTERPRSPSPDVEILTEGNVWQPVGRPMARLSAGIPVALPSTTPAEAKPSTGTPEVAHQARARLRDPRRAAQGTTATDSTDTVASNATTLLKTAKGRTDTSSTDTAAKDTTATDTAAKDTTATATAAKGTAATATAAKGTAATATAAKGTTATATAAKGTTATNATPSAPQTQVGLARAPGDALQGHPGVGESRAKVGLPGAPRDVSAQVQGEALRAGGLQWEEGQARGYQGGEGQAAGQEQEAHTLKGKQERQDPDSRAGVAGPSVAPRQAGVGGPSSTPGTPRVGSPSSSAPIAAGMAGGASAAPGAPAVTGPSSAPGAVLPLGQAQGAGRTASKRTLKRERARERKKMRINSLMTTLPSPADQDTGPVGSQGLSKGVPAPVSRDGGQPSGFLAPPAGVASASAAPGAPAVTGPTSVPGAVLPSGQAQGAARTASKRARNRERVQKWIEKKLDSLMTTPPSPADPGTGPVESQGLPQEVPAPVSRDGGQPSGFLAQPVLPSARPQNAITPEPGHIQGAWAEVSGLVAPPAPAQGPKDRSERSVPRSRDPRRRARGPTPPRGPTEANPVLARGHGEAVHDSDRLGPDTAVQDTGRLGPGTAVQNGGRVRPDAAVQDGGRAERAADKDMEEGELVAEGSFGGAGEERALSGVSSTALPALGAGPAQNVPADSRKRRKRDPRLGVIGMPGARQGQGSKVEGARAVDSEQTHTPSRAPGSPGLSLSAEISPGTLRMLREEVGLEYSPEALAKALEAGLLERLPSSILAELQRHLAFVDVGPDGQPADGQPADGPMTTAAVVTSAQRPAREGTTPARGSAGDGVRSGRRASQRVSPVPGAEQGAPGYAQGPSGGRAPGAGLDGAGSLAGAGAGLQAQHTAPQAGAGVGIPQAAAGVPPPLPVRSQEEVQRRAAEVEIMVRGRKLCLVLDLDHTLLNSTKISELHPDMVLRLKDLEAIEAGKIRERSRELYRIPSLGIWTKLRPGIWSFLARVRDLFELHIYTLGTKPYAAEMARILDPTGELFQGRIISKGIDSIRDLDARTSHAGGATGAPLGPDGLHMLSADEVTKLERRVLHHSKDLEGVLGMENAALILDDTANVWPHHFRNLIQVERYTYFPGSRKSLGMAGPSLLERGHDEREGDAMLSSALGVLERVHGAYFRARNRSPAGESLDVRDFLREQQRRVLHGCKILFSRVFPVHETRPQAHALWQLAEQFGAECSLSIDSSVTHVVAASSGTDKVHWAKASGRFSVAPAWVEASAALYRRANEQEFPVPSIAF